MLRQSIACTLIFLLVPASAPAIDLFDVLPLDAFWKSQNITVSPESMLKLLNETPTKDISKLVEQLGAEQFVEREKAYQELKSIGGSFLPQLEKEAEATENVEIRQRLGQLIKTISQHAANRATLQMAAMRSVQARKMKQALPALRKLTASPQPLIASYAREAIAALEGQPFKRPESTGAMLQQDLELLPYDCGMVAQVRGSNAKLGDIYAIVAGMPHGGQRAVERFQRELIQVALRLGNIRADSMTVGVSDDFGPRAGYGIFIFRGHGSKLAIESFIRSNSRIKEPINVNGIQVWRPDREVALIIPSDELLILLVSDREKYLPIARVTQSLKAPSNKLQLNPTMRDLISKVDQNKAAWAVVKIPSLFRGEIPPLQPFDWIVGEIDQDDQGALQASFRGYGPDAKAIASSMVQTRLLLSTFAVQADEVVKTIPVAKSMIDSFKSIRFDSKGNLATLTLSADNAGTVVFSPLIIEHIWRAKRSAERAVERAKLPKKRIERDVKKDDAKAADKVSDRRPPPAALGEAEAIELERRHSERAKKAVKEASEAMKKAAKEAVEAAKR